MKAPPGAAAISLRLAGGRGRSEAQRQQGISRGSGVETQPRPVEGPQPEVATAFVAVGLLQRPERVVLMAAPQALFGLFFNGWPLAIIIVILTVTAWITVIQRVAFVYTATTRADEAVARKEGEARPRLFARRRSPRPLLKGE